MIMVSVVQTATPQSHRAYLNHHQILKVDGMVPQVVPVLMAQRQVGKAKLQCRKSTVGEDPALYTCHRGD